MEIFVSWSGRRSHEMAEVLRDWLVRVLQYSHPFVSSRDIPKGAQWLVEISERLTSTSEGLICVTPENQHQPWLNYEAGALSKTTGQTAVRTVLLGMEPADVVAGPLSAFQHTKALDKSGMESLVRSINDRAPSPVSAEPLAWAFESAWPDLHESLTIIMAASPETAAPPPRDDKDVADETLELVRSISNRLAELAGSGRADGVLMDSRGVAVPKISSHMADQIKIGDRVHHPSFGDGDVTDVEGAGDQKVARVIFAVGPKRLLLRYAPLSLVKQDPIF